MTVNYETLRLKIRKAKLRMFGKYNGGLLKNKSFTIISNNCWGGNVYESYGLQKQSPTVGLFFMPEDYIRLLGNLDAYFASELRFISPNEARGSRFSPVANDKRYGHYPIAVLQPGGGGTNETVEVYFLHYHSEEEARLKWRRRLERINSERMLVKFNDERNCTQTQAQAFLNLPYKNKLFFTVHDWPLVGETVIRLRQFPKYETVMNSYEPLWTSAAADITGMLNRL